MQITETERERFKSRKRSWDRKLEEIVREAWTKSYRRKWHTINRLIILRRKTSFNEGIFFVFLFLSVNLEGVGGGHKIVAGDEGFCRCVQELASRRRCVQVSDRATEAMVAMALQQDLLRAQQQPGATSNPPARRIQSNVQWTLRSQS
jgi:hypothetical protein